MAGIDLIRKNALIISAVLVLALITVNTGIIYYNDWVLKDTTRVKAETERAGYLVSQIWNQVVRNVDIGMRGYAITKNEDLLGPMRDGIRDNPIILGELRTITQKQGFEHPGTLDSLAVCVNKFIATTQHMVGLIKIDSMTEFHAALSADPGRAAWMVYDRNARVVKAFEDDLSQQAQTSYKSANDRTLVVQTILNIIAFPSLLFLIFNVVKEKRERRELFSKLEENNRAYLFNPGTDANRAAENDVIDFSIRNFKTAAHFINQVSNGNFSVTWDGFNAENEKLNTSNLAGELVLMRDKLKNIKAQDEIRNWTTEGLARFSDVLRKNQDNLEALSLDILTFLTKYLQAQQGCLFIVQEDPEDETHSYLEMAACYAFEKKKYVQKKLEIGQGLIGQTFLEGTPVLLTDLPNGYTEITSGLGHKTPSGLLIVPMKANEKVEAVIELAGFQKFEKHQVEFMEKVGELTASTLGSVKNNEKMKAMVDRFKTQTEQLKSQEEELRQNLEEMEATQEALIRAEKERQG
ncbi:GAF domain-containing protein [Chryseolinea lacunae]|uniref:GAF domain-containing protein n=1 Tax=Chryseolinea lacunae TaxID=2801331 RepID=A0ABS1KWU4_9BACT|nr:GAF domain-containing protein [Chryseolinea lacunae]MBL0743943.1 GAF domain-containing protein [Chryseolinea lacunae]